MFYCIETYSRPITKFSSRFPKDPFINTSSKRIVGERVRPRVGGGWVCTFILERVMSVILTLFELIGIFFRALLPN